VFAAGSQAVNNTADNTAIRTYLIFILENLLRGHVKTQKGRRLMLQPRVPHRSLVNLRKVAN
jgi:hypothetical protein